MALSIGGNQGIIDRVSASPDIIIDNDWYVSGYEEYSNENIILNGDLVIQNGGHLVLNNCNLIVMYEYLQPYSLIVEDGGTFELYYCYVTDEPDDDDSDMLSAWYYFFAREGSTLIIEDSTVRQVGFLDPTNPEHIGLSVGTNQGHVENTRINSSIVALTFVGNNTGFYADNIDISDISMAAINMYGSHGAVISNVSFQNIGEGRVIDIQSSHDFTFEDIELNTDEYFRIQYSSGFTLKNITGNGPERLLEIEDSSDFKVSHVTDYGLNSWNRLMEISRCSDFQVNQVVATDDYGVVSIRDSSNGKITNITGSNVTRIVDLENSVSIEISELNVSNSTEAVTIWNSENITINDVYFSDAFRPISLIAVNGSVFSDFTIVRLEDYGMSIRSDSNDVAISNGSIETDSMFFTTGIWADSSSVMISDVELYNLNRSILGYGSDIHGENIAINGTYKGDEGIFIENAESVHLSNVSVRYQRWRGIYLRSSLDSDIWMDNLMIKDSDFDAITIEDSNATLSNININNSVYDLAVFGSSSRSFVTVMNSTLDLVFIDESDVVFINTTNTTSILWGMPPRSLTRKWWVDVYVSDMLGPVAGAEVYIYDAFFFPEVISITDLNGYARNIPVIDTIYDGGEESKNPHYTWAGGPGWNVFNATPYMVTQNMQVSVSYQWDAPPNAPTNLIAQSNENSDVVLTWDPSTSWDVKEYNIYIAKSQSDLLAYIGSGIPNATASVPTYTHISGSEDWQKYWYGVKAVDQENESVEYVRASCGDWVVNATTPQYVDGMNITVEGSVLDYGELELRNTSLRILSNARGEYGIYIHNLSIFKCENVTIEGDTTYPYFFNIQEGAEVAINDSEIKRPGSNDPNAELPMKGVYSLTEDLRITNSTFEVVTCGLGIFTVPYFTGRIYNVTFIVPSGLDAEYLLKISDSAGVKVQECHFEGETQYGIHGFFSQEINVTRTNISIYGDWGETYYGIFMQECTDSQLFDNTLIYGNPGVYFAGSTNITIEASNISSRRDTAIYGLFSQQTTIRDCDFDSLMGDQHGDIYLSWCSDSVIEDMSSTDVNPFLFLDNATGAAIRNLSMINGENGIRLLNSNNIYIYDTYITFMFTGMTVIGCRDISLVNTEINLTFYCIEIKSPGPINFINCTIANGIGNEIIAEGFEGQYGEIFMINSTITSISDSSLKLNNSAAVYLINTSFNLTKLVIEDAASRVELFHYLSVQVYDIDLNQPPWANITIFNFHDFMVYNEQVTNGFAKWITIHERTIFRDDEYSDNPHRVFFDDGSHYGSAEVYVNETGYIEVYVSNELPWILLVDIYGCYDMPDPLPDILTYDPTTEFDILLNYTYVDPENDPESGTLIHWYVNGVYNSTFDGMQNISHDYTSKYQTWFAVVYPSDGYDSTYPTFPYESNVIFISNTPPVVSNVIISPIDPTGGDNLYVEYDVFDIDGDGLDSSKTTHKWYHYNETLGDWEYSNIDSYYLPSSYTSKGQQWKCDVTPHDGDDEGGNVTSQVVTIGNTPPSIQNQKIMSETGNITITSMDNLKVEYNFMDVDGDDENGTKYEWYQSNDGFNWVKYDINSSILSYSYTQRGDLWRCRIIPSDGEDNGTEAWTDAVEIFNTPPIVSNVTILPQVAISADTLQVTYDYYDYDGDADNGTSFRWIYEDALGAKDSGIKGNETPPGVIKKGQTWYCFVLPSDGRNVGKEMGSSGVSINNTPPEIEDARVLFETNGDDRWLTLSITPEDIDGDNLEVIEIKWFVNGINISKLEDNLTVPGNYLVKNEIWNATIRVFDGEDWSDWYTTDEVSIPNRPPYINGTPILAPKKALSNQTLTPNYEELFKDEDGDSLATAEIKWYKDNGHMEDFDDEENILGDSTKKGEIWYYKVRVSDGEDYSDWYSSTTSIIENSPPSDVTISPDEGYVTMNETETMKFEVSAQDMDEEDELSYRWTLDGRIVLLDEDVGNSIYLMKTDYESEGEYLLRLVISDGDDIYENTWSINVHKLNRLPEITVVEPEGRSAQIKEKQSLNFVITKSDPDGDNLDVYWYLDNAPTPVWEGSDKYTYTPDYYSGGRSHNITVEVKEKDTSANLTYTWDIYVEDVEEEVAEKFLGLLWDQWSIILEILVIAGTGILGFIGYNKLSKKKGALKTYMAEIEEVSTSEDLESDEYEEKLNELELKINDEFRDGKIEDLHYLMLQEFIANRRGEVRKAAITQKFGGLPKEIVEDLDEMLKDGKISRDEYEVFVSTISKTKSLSPHEKKELSEIIEKWEDEDKDLTQEESQEKMEKHKEPEDKGIDKDLDKESDELVEDKEKIEEESPVEKEEHKEPEEKDIEDKPGKGTEEKMEDKDSEEKKASAKKKSRKNQKKTKFKRAGK